MKTASGRRDSMLLKGDAAGGRKGPYILHIGVATLGHLMPPSHKEQQTSGQHHADKGKKQLHLTKTGQVGFAVSGK